MNGITRREAAIIEAYRQAEDSYKLAIDKLLQIPPEAEQETTPQLLPDDVAGALRLALQKEYTAKITVLLPTAQGCRVVMLLV